MCYIPTRFSWSANRHCTFITPQCYILGQWLPKTTAFDAAFDAPFDPRCTASFPYTGYHQTASYSPKTAPLHFCTSGSEMPLIEEPGLYKRPCPRSPSHSVSTTNTLSGALCLRPLPSASRTSSLSHLLAVLPLPSSPAAVAGRCATRQPRAVGPVRHFRLTLRAASRLGAL